MPPLTRLRVSALADLARQLRYAPADAARRHLDRAEALFDRLDPLSTYPEDWIVFAVTGFRADIKSPAMITGSALIADLAALVERLSIAARFSAGELPADRWLTPDALARRWLVSRRTLERFKRLGLLARRALSGGPRRRPVTLYSLASAQRLERTHADRLSSAGAYSRLSDAERQAITGGPAPKPDVAPRPRSRGTIRRALTRAGLARPRANLNARQRRTIWAALRSGSAPAELARQFNRSVPTIHRAAHQARAELLATLDLAPAFEPGRDVDLLDPAHLEPPAAAVALGEPGAPHLAEHLRRTLDAGWPDPAVEPLRARAYVALRAVAGRDIAALDRNDPSAAALDLIETRLLWAARLKAELVRSQQMLTLKTIEGRLDRTLDTLPAGPARSLLLACIDAIAGAIDPHDPFKGGRLASPAGIALNRAVARWESAEGAPILARRAQPARAESRSDPAAVTLPDWTRLVAPWQEFLEPDPHLRNALVRLSAADRTLLESRLGWSGERPRSLAELARSARVSLHVMARRERTALRRALPAS